jgi:hypothetical protein
MVSYFEFLQIHKCKTTWKSNANGGNELGRGVKKRGKTLWFRSRGGKMALAARGSGSRHVLHQCFRWEY